MMFFCCAVSSGSQLLEKDYEIGRTYYEKENDLRGPRAEPGLVGLLQINIAGGYGSLNNKFKFALTPDVMMNIIELPCV